MDKLANRVYRYSLGLLLAAALVSPVCAYADEPTVDVPETEAAVALSNDDTTSAENLAPGADERAKGDAIDEASLESSVKESLDEPSDGQAQELQTMAVDADAIDSYAAQHANTVPDGVYCITTALNEGYALDVRGGSRKAGAQIILYASRSTHNQRWKIQNVGGGYVTIQSVLSGRYLQIDQAKSGSKLVQYADELTGDRNQRWVVCRESDGHFSVASALDINYVLNVRYGARAFTKEGPIEVIAYKRGETLNQNELWGISVTKDILDEEAMAHKDDLPDGMYLVGKASDESKTLDVQRGSLENRAKIIVYTKTPSINQVWVVAHNDQGYATITSALSGKSIDVRGGKAVKGAEIIQWTKSDTSRNQQWIVSAQEDGSYEIISALTGWRFVLDVNGSTAILNEDQLRSEGSGKWMFTSAPEQLVNYFALEDGMYRIKTALNDVKGVDKSIDLSAKTGYANLWDSKDQKNQLWNVKHDKQGFVHFVNAASKLELGFEGGRTVGTQTPTRWIVKPAADGTFTISYEETGKVMDVRRSSTANGSMIITYAASGGVNQQWQIKKDNGFTTIDGKKYLINDAGKKLTGIRTVNGNKFYFDPKQGGALATVGIVFDNDYGISYANGRFTTGAVAHSSAPGTRYLVAWDGVLHEIPQADDSQRHKESYRDSFRDKIAHLVAECIIPESEITTKNKDEIRVKAACMYVRAFVGNDDRERYTIQYDTVNWPSPYFGQAFGPFSFGKYSCAGCKWALDAILRDMGFSPDHLKGAPPSEHQYLGLTMDGRRGWADGMWGEIGFSADSHYHCNL